jgi:hypothetical protein
MADLATRGYTGVLHTFSENDFAYYRETMAEIVAASHAEGLFVQASPWGLGRTFGGEAESRWVAFHPEECQVLDDGRRVAAACLNSSAYREFCKEWADWVLECGVDSVFWDEPAWVMLEHVGVDDPARWTCRCDRCAERFGGPVPAELTPEVTRFRQESVVGFLRELVGHVVSRGGRQHDLPPARDGGNAGARRLGRGRFDLGPRDARDGPLLDALGRAGRAVRAALLPVSCARLARRTDRRACSGWPSFGLGSRGHSRLEGWLVARALRRASTILWTVGYEAVPAHDPSIAHSRRGRSSGTG